MKKNKQLYIYYGILFVVNLLAGLRYHGEASAMMRLGFLLLVIVPAFRHIKLMPAIIALFFISSTAGYIEGLMPSQLYWYAAISIIAVLSLSTEHIPLGKAPVVFWILLFLVTIVNMVGGMAVENISYSLLILICFCLIMHKRNDEVVSLFSMVFALISLSLSIMFIMSDTSETILYGYSGLERVTSFADPNYFACTLGMGALTSIIELFRTGKKPLFLKAFYTFVAVFSFVILILNASRGGVLSFSVAAAVIVLFSRIGKTSKFATIVALFFLIVFIYENEYFALLEYRMQNDTGGGSHRTDIWIHKLTFFIRNSHFLQWLVGHGHNGGLSIGAYQFGYGSGKVLGFHNDFVAFFVDYGIIGLSLFVGLLCKIYRLAKNNVSMRTFGYAALAFLFIQAMTLESFTAGSFSIWAFTIYALLLCQNKELV